MLFLILATIASASNALTMKFAGSRSGNSWSLLLFNYIAATVISALSSVRSDSGFGSVPQLVWVLGIVAGVLFVASFALLQLNVRENGATISSSLARMGAIVPLVLSIALFGENPTPAGAAGVVCAVAATIMLGIPKSDASDDSGSTPSTRWLLIPMVLVSGLADTMAKVFETFADSAHEETYVLATFATALVVCLVMLLRARERPAFVDVSCGILLGAFNFFSTDFMVRALIELPAYMVYTAFSMGAILIVYAANSLVMHERLTARDRAALCFIVLALVLINLPR